MSEKPFDIEHFPTSPTARRMISRISPIYDRSYVGKWIFQVMGLDMDEVRLRFGELPDQAFPETATWGLPYWEQRYGITGMEGKEAALRRQEVLSRRGARAPLNPKKLEAILSALTGREVIVTEDVAPYTFAVEILDGDSGFDYAAAVQRVKRVKPSHQAFTLGLTIPSPAVRVSAFCEARLAVEVWPGNVEAVTLADAHIQAGATAQHRAAAEIWPGTVERVEGTAAARTGAAAQRETVTRIWPGAVERTETKAGGAGIAVETHQTIEIWP